MWSLFGRAADWTRCLAVPWLTWTLSAVLWLLWTLSCGAVVALDAVCGAVVTLDAVLCAVDLDAVLRAVDLDALLRAVDLDAVLRAVVTLDALSSDVVAVWTRRIPKLRPSRGLGRRRKWFLISTTHMRPPFSPRARAPLSPDGHLRWCDCVCQKGAVVCPMQKTKDQGILFHVLNSILTRTV